MKKTLMLIVLLIMVAVTSNAQSTYPIQDTVARVAPHCPAVHRWQVGDGKKWHNGVLSTVKYATKDTVKDWIHDYELEAHLFHEKVGPYLNANNPSTLSSGEAEVYKDLHTIWIMILAHHH